MKEYLRSKEEVLEELDVTESGLSSTEAGVRLEKNGKNKLTEGKKESSLRRFLKQLAEPMTIILLVAAAVSAFVEIFEGISTGEGLGFPTDVVIILAVVIINAILGVLQESKAEKALEALEKIAAAEGIAVQKEILRRSHVKGHS